MGQPLAQFEGLDISQAPDQPKPVDKGTDQFKGLDISNAPDQPKRPPGIYQAEEPSTLSIIWNKITESDFDKRRARAGEIASSELFPSVPVADMDPTLLQAWRKGEEASIGGMMNRQKVQDIPPEVREMWGSGADLVYGLSTFIHDIPVYGSGAFMGSFFGGPPGVFAGAIGFHQGLRHLLVKTYDEGKIETVSDFWGTLVGTSYATAKGYATGLVAGTTGKAVTGVLPRGTPKLAAELTKGMAEINSLVAAGAALEGRLPEKEEFTSASIFILGAKSPGIAKAAVRQMSRKIGQIYAKIGRRPAQIIDDIKNDISIKEDLLDPDREMPLAYERTKGEMPTVKKEVDNQVRTLVEEASDPEIAPERRSEIYSTLQSLRDVEPKPAKDFKTFVREKGHNWEEVTGIEKDEALLGRLKEEYDALTKPAPKEPISKEPVHPQETFLVDVAPKLTEEQYRVESRKYWAEEDLGRPDYEKRLEVRDRIVKFREAEAKPAPKEPWEMTSREYNETQRSRMPLPEGGELGSGNKLYPTVYVRFGELPSKGKPSLNHITGKPEKGVSVYKAWYDKKTGKYILDTLQEETVFGELNITQEVLAGGKRKIYQVSGKRKSGIGADTEDLLDASTVKTEKEISRNTVVFMRDWASKDYVTLSGKKVLPEDMPDWKSSGEGIEQGVHRYIVKQAIAEGKPVPKEVLAEYPELGVGKEKPYGAPTEAGAITFERTTPSGFKWTDAESEQNYQAALPEKTTIRGWIKQAYTTAKHKIQRPFEHMAQGKEFAQAYNDLIQLAKKRMATFDATVRNLQAITEKLNREDMDLFSRQVAINSFLGDLAEGKTKFPWFGTKEKLLKAAEELNEWTKLNDTVKDALIKRKIIWDKLRADYIQAMKDINFDVEERLRRPNYWHHQVLSYIEDFGLHGTGGRYLKTPTGRGWLKGRVEEGTLESINRNYLATEAEVMSQMLYDIEVAKTIKSIDDHYNIATRVKQAAKEKNYEMIVGGKKNLSELNRLRGKAAEIRSHKPLDSGDKQQLKAISERIWELDPTMPWRQKMAIGFSKLKKEGHTLDQYGEIDFNTMKKLADEGFPSALSIFKAMQEREAFFQETLGAEYRTWKTIDSRMIPKGYTNKYRPREGNVFFHADTIPSKMAEELWSGRMEELGVTKKDLGKALAKGGPFREFVIPVELAATLEGYSAPAKAGWYRKSIKGWKVWQLVSPRRYPKYNIRNLSGDADAMFAGNPRAFRKIPRAIRELFEYYGRRGEPTEELVRWVDRGGPLSTLRAIEIGDIDTLEQFIRVTERKGTATRLPVEIWQGYWKAAKFSTDFREAILRYANFLEYAEQMARDPQGRPRNFGASLPDEIMGLADLNDRAYLLSNELLGAYDRIGVAGQSLRETIYPFWSWKEANFKRYHRLFKNAAADNHLAYAVGAKTLGLTVRAPFKAVGLLKPYPSKFSIIGVGKFMIRATALWSFLQVWNHKMFPEEEADLGDDTAARPHIILGRDENGKVITFNRIGALSDLLETFGLDAAPQYVDRWFSGRMTLQEIGVEMTKSPVNALASGVMPFTKLAAEIGTRQTLWPDIFNKRLVRDRILHLMRSFGLENEYKALADLPRRPYMESLSKMFIYETDPLEAAYYDIMSLKIEFLKKRGKHGEGFWITPKSTALYNAKRALRYGDEESFNKYMDEYYAFPDSSLEGEIRSFNSLDPLHGLKGGFEEQEFEDSLNDRDRMKLVKAYKYYDQIMSTDIQGGINQ